MNAPRSRGLLPLPRLFAESEGRFDARGGLVVAAPEGLETQASALLSWLGGIEGVGPATLARPGALGAVQTDADRTAADRTDAALGAAARVELGFDATIEGEEDYRLVLAPGLATIAARSARGAARGGATLWQLFLSEGATPACCRVEDGPRFRWRGFMLDCARNFFPVETIERFLDLAALHKLNVFHWHLSDDQAWRLDLPSLPELARLGSRRLDRRYNVPIWKEGSYSAADVSRIVAFAAARGIEVVPEIETPGHALALLASHPELACLSPAGEGGEGRGFSPEDRYGVFEDILCAGNDEVFGLLQRVFAEIAALFPGPFVHVGGDEAPKARWKTCPRCAERLAALGLGRSGAGEASDHELELLQAWFMGRVAGILGGLGKRMIGWDEMLDAGSGLPPEAAVMSWRGYAGGLAGARRGHEVVMCPQTKACYLDHKHLDRAEEPGQLGVCTVRDSWAFEPVPPGLTAEEAGLILGGQANLWSELLYFGRQAEYMAFPRLCALSEVFWSPKEGRAFPEFTRRLDTQLRRLSALGVNYYRGAFE
jgi:hexosaminidase